MVFPFPHFILLNMKKFKWKYKFTKPTLLNINFLQNWKCWLAYHSNCVQLVKLQDGKNLCNILSVLIISFHPILCPSTNNWCIYVMYQQVNNWLWTSSLQFADNKIPDNIAKYCCMKLFYKNCQFSIDAAEICFSITAHARHNFTSILNNS